MVLEQTGTELIEACRRGERDAFRQLFELYKDKVYTIALRYSGDPATAEDIAQDTFVKLFARIEGFRGESGFDSWLYRVVVNSCFDHKRSTRRWLPLLSGFTDLMRTPETGALDEMMRAESNGQLGEALATLPPDQRMSIVLRYSQDLSYEEIGAIMNCPPGTVASRLNRALKLLEKRLRRLHARVD